MKPNWKIITHLAEGWEILINLFTIKQWLVMLLILGLATAILVPVLL